MAGYRNSAEFDLTFCKRETGRVCMFAQIGSWISGIFDPSDPPEAYLLRAGYIAVSLAAFAASFLYYNALDGSIGWAAVSALFVIGTTANGIWPFELAIDSLTGISPPGDLVDFVLIAIFIVLIPGLLLASPLVLAWMLIQAARAARVGFR